MANYFISLHTVRFKARSLCGCVFKQINNFIILNKLNVNFLKIIQLVEMLTSWLFAKSGGRFEQGTTTK